MTFVKFITFAYRELKIFFMYYFLFPSPTHTYLTYKRHTSQQEYKLQNWMQIYSQIYLHTSHMCFTLHEICCYRHHVVCSLLLLSENKFMLLYYFKLINLFSISFVSDALYYYHQVLHKCQNVCSYNFKNIITLILK